MPGLAEILCWLCPFHGSSFSSLSVWERRSLRIQLNRPLTIPTSRTDKEETKASEHCLSKDDEQFVSSNLSQGPLWLENDPRFTVVWWIRDGVWFDDHFRCYQTKQIILKRTSEKKNYNFNLSSIKTYNTKKVKNIFFL